MKQIVEASDCIGKRIAAVQSGDNDELMAVVFDDQTFVVFRARRMFDNAEIEVEAGFNPLSWQYNDLVAAFGPLEAMSMHLAAVERQSAERAEWQARRKVALQEELRKLESPE